MQPAEIIGAIARRSSPFPRPALESAIAQWSVIEPLLIQELDAFCDHPDRYEADETFQLPLVSLYLFAQFRSAAAIPSVLRFLSLPPGHVEQHLGNAVSEEIDKLLASIFQSNPSRLRELLYSPTVYEFVRGGALEALSGLATSGFISKDEVRGIIQELVGGKLERTRSWVWECAHGVAAWSGFDELRDAFKSAQVEGIVDPTTWEQLSDSPGYRPGLPFIENAIESLEWWLSSGDEDGRDADAYDFESEGGGPFVAPEPFVREAPKVGRNDPCPCGSGKKFKKCCG